MGPNSNIFRLYFCGSTDQRSFSKSNGPILVEDGDRPEMGSRIGSGANVGYVTAVENNEIDGADWLTDREVGLRSSAPLPLQLLVVLLYLIVGFLAMAVT